MHTIHKKVFDNTLSNILTIRHFLGKPAAVGIAMLFMSMEPDPWRSTQQIAEMADVSEDTVRRRVHDLVSINRAECRTEGGRHLFRLKPSFAQTVVSKMKWDHTIIGSVPDIPQDATADCG
jgi:hypothetical protein